MKKVYEGHCIHCHRSIKLVAGDPPAAGVWYHTVRLSAECHDGGESSTFAEPFKSLTADEMLEFIRDAANQDQVVVEVTIETINGWLARGDKAAIYENKALDHSQLGRKICLSFGSTEAMVEELWPPEQCPDIRGMLIGWPYRLIAGYSGEPLVLPDAFVNENWEEGHDDEHA